MPTKQANAAKVSKPMSVAQRKALATKQVLSDLAGENENAAITAALEVMHEHLAWDTALKRRLQQKYEELDALGPKKGKADLGPEPVPISGPSLDQISPYGKVNPYDLRDWYGEGQLRAVLIRLTAPSLREAVDITQSRNPETKATSRTAKQKMIDYIMEQVAPGY